MTNQDLVSFQISSEGKAISEKLQVVEIEVHNNVSGVSQARIVLLADNDNVSELIDASDFETERKIEIKLGYDGKDRSVFNGVITGQSLHIKSGQGIAYEVVCESFDQEQVLPPEDLLKAKASLTLTYGQDILSCSIHSDHNVSTQVMGGIGTQGSNAILPGSIVSLEGLGKAFNGNQYVSGVNHHVANGTWYTDVNIGLVEESDSAEAFSFDDGAELMD